jgi:transposase
MLRVPRQPVAFWDRPIAALSEDLATRLAHGDDALTRWPPLPGVERRTAEILIAEIGPDRPRFPSAGHRVS